MMRVHQKLFRHKAHQLVLHLAHVLARRDFGAVGNAEDMGVDRHDRLPERRVQHHVCRFTPHSGQCFQRGTVGGHFAVIFFQQDAAGLHDVFGLGFVKSYGFGVFHHAVQTQIQHRLRRGGHGKQFCRRLVHTYVGGLRRQENGDKQLEGRVEVEFGGRVRIGSAETLEDFLADAFVHDAGAVCMFLK